MALQKTKQLKHGLSGNYWKITKCVIDKLALKLDITISLFRSKQHSDDGESPLPLSYNISGSFTKQELSGDITALAYSFIKSVASEPIEQTPSINRIFNKKTSIKLDLNGAEDV